MLRGDAKIRRNDHATMINMCTGINYESIFLREMSELKRSAKSKTWHPQASVTLVMFRERTNRFCLSLHFCKSDTQYYIPPQPASQPKHTFCASGRCVTAVSAGGDRQKWRKERGIADLRTGVTFLKTTKKVLLLT